MPGSPKIRTTWPSPAFLLPPAHQEIDFLITADQRGGGRSQRLKAAARD